MIKKRWKPLKNNRGNGYPLAVAVTLVLVMIFTGISEYFRLVIVAQGVRDAMQDAVIATVTENYNEVYHGVREGYSGGYQPVAEDFEQTLDYGEIYDRLDVVLGLEEKNGVHIKRNPEGAEQFKIWELQVDIVNAPFAIADDAGSRFQIESSIILEVPISFCGELLPPMQMQVESRAGYTPIF